MVVDVVGATDSGPTSFHSGRTSAAAADAYRFEMLDDRLELTGLAALRNENCDVALRRHSEIAVDGLGEMEEGGRRTGRCERRGNLAPDVARLAKAADDQLSRAVPNEIDGMLEFLTQTIGQRVKRPCLVVEDVATEIENFAWRAFLRRCVMHGPHLASAAAAVKPSA